MRKIMLFGMAWLILGMAPHIVSANKGSFLFYNAASGEGATAQLNSAGTYQFVGLISGFAKGWTHITGL